MNGHGLTVGSGDAFRKLPEARRYQQNRLSGTRNYVERNAAQFCIAQLSATASHHDQVGGAAVGCTENGVRGLAADGFRADVYSCTVRGKRTTNSFHMV